MVDVKCRFFGIVASIRMVFVSEWCVNFTISGPADAAQSVDRTPLRNGSEPSCERTIWIVGLARPVNGEQGFLHNVVNQIGSYSLATRHSRDERYALAYQRFLRASITSLPANHPHPPPP